MQRHGIYYQVDVFDVDGLPLSAQSWEKQMQWIVDDADRHKGVTIFNIILYIRKSLLL